MSKGALIFFIFLLQIASGERAWSAAGPDLPNDDATTGVLARQGTILGMIPWDGIYVSSHPIPGGRYELGLIASSEPTQDTLLFQYEGKTDVQIPIVTLSGTPLTTPNGKTIVGTITSPYYAVVGEVSYENLGPGSYLEMWSHFTPAVAGLPGEAYFSRTLAPMGPLGELSGTHDWREFWLPFDSTDAKTSVASLDLNLHVKGAGNGNGNVYLRYLKLVQFTKPVWLENSAASLTGVDQATVDISSNLRSVSYRIDGQACSNLAALQQILTQRHEADPKLAVVIHADRDVRYDDIRNVLDLAARASIAQVTFETAEPPRPSSSLNMVKVALIVSTLFLCIGLGFAFFFLHRHKLRRHERELRRIASLDS